MNNVIPFKNREIEDYIGRSLKVGGGGASNLGSVCLLGAGPGDVELMTIKGMKALQRADVVVYDRLVNPELLALAGDQCEKIYVGKRKDKHSLPQEKICHLLVSLAMEGKFVVRLKGGDPFIFGRGGEELDVLEGAGIPCQVIPGITAATGCAAATGIPLTHRDCAHALTFITAHRRDGELKFNWELALHEDHTVVFYMGLSVVTEIAAGLIARGRAASTPIAIIANGSTPDQQVLIATLADVGETLCKSALPSPALIILGEVVKRRAGLQAVVEGAQALG